MILNLNGKTLLFITLFLMAVRVCAFASSARSEVSVLLLVIDGDGILDFEKTPIDPEKSLKPLPRVVFEKDALSVLVGRSFRVKYVGLADSIDDRFAPKIPPDKKMDFFRFPLVLLKSGNIQKILKADFIQICRITAEGNGNLGKSFLFHVREGLVEDLGTVTGNSEKQVLERFSAKVCEAVKKSMTYIHLPVKSRRGIAYFHRRDAEHLGGSGPEVIFQNPAEAEADGFSPCPVCFPGKYVSLQSVLGKPLVKEASVSKLLPCRDPLILARVDTVLEQLRGPGIPGVSINVNVVDSSRVDSFFKPGGEIYLTSKMVKITETDAELAAVIAHEVARHNLYTSAGLDDELSADSKNLPDEFQDDALSEETTSSVIVEEKAEQALRKRMEQNSMDMTVGCLAASGFDADSFRTILLKIRDLDQPEKCRWEKIQPITVRGIARLKGLSREWAAGADRFNKLEEADSLLFFSLKSHLFTHPSDPSETLKFMDAYLDLFKQTTVTEPVFDNFEFIPADKQPKDQRGFPGEIKPPEKL